MWLASHYWEAMFAVMIAGFFIVVWRLHESNDNKFSFEQFFTDEDGRANLKRLVGFGAFGVHSWVTARYAVYTPLNEYVISLLALYALLWAGVLMLGKGMERLLDALAGAVAKKLGVTLQDPAKGES